ncbi:DNA helicase loader [Pseudomonas phage PspYZU05]|uniref:Loader of DNA helicase n=1 Tax=Pseudomonas phage PspYZU05 TaxID=1983556 RepID=A0A2U7NN37_9CAUD|nr:DNA helicase loader [Pseudomonas phage PspYZU05]ASD52117.1 loader of DNA helicase [Pseudomonas phage PspYZU05]
MPPEPNRRVNGKSVYVLYLEIKQHLLGKYDIKKYNWMMKVSDKAYQKRKDKYFFEKLANNYNLRELTLLFLSNLVANQDAWIGEISDSDALIFYREYVGRFETMKTTYISDIKNIYYFSKKVECSLGDIFSFNEKNNTSYIFKLLQSNVISYETFMLLDSFLDIINKHDESASDLIWMTHSTKLNAYKKLLTIDKAICRQIFIDTIKSCKN